MDTQIVADVLAEIAAERQRQDTKWGEQNHPDGTGGEARRHDADLARRACQQQFAENTGTWLDILDEETAEAYAEDDPVKLRAELIQVAAVAVAWIEAIDRRVARKLITDPVELAAAYGLTVDPKWMLPSEHPDGTYGQGGAA